MSWRETKQIRVIPAGEISGLADLGKQMPEKVWWCGEGAGDPVEKKVAVVGSRHMTEYGRRVIEKLVPSLVAQGLTVVSGLMYGVDQEAARGCLESGGKTIAVLGWGINYTQIGREEEELMQRIVDGGGAVVSLGDSFKPTYWTFPVRDAVMAAMSTEIYVVEAAAKSGSMITAEWGAKLARTVWAVPGPITSSVSEGTNKLIAEGKARMWLPQQQLSLSLSSSTRNIGHAESNTKTAEIYRLLENDAISVDELARKTNRPVSELGVQLSLMQLVGEVEEKDGKFRLIK